MESKDVERGDEEINEVKNNFCNKRKQRRDICTICSKTMRRDNLKRHMMKKNHIRLSAPSNGKISKKTQICEELINDARNVFDKAQSNFVIAKKNIGEIRLLLSAIQEKYFDEERSVICAQERLILRRKDLTDIQIIFLDAKKNLTDAESTLVDTQKTVCDAESTLVDAQRTVCDAEMNNWNISINDVM